MFIPELNAPAMRSRHRRTFFGGDRRLPFAILTPIGAIYDALGPAKASADGWWPCKSAHGGLVVLTPQATPAIDALCALEPDVPVLFLGFAGGLGAVSAGDVVEPSAALLGPSSFARTSPSPLAYRDVRVGTVSCFNESDQQRGFLEEHVDCVDMECGWLFATAERQRRTLRAVLIISDHVSRRPFTEVAAAAVRQAIEDVAEAVRDGALFGDRIPSGVSVR